MINREDEFLGYLDKANSIFERAHYCASNSDIENLAKNMLILEKRGLSKLNCRLISGGRKIWDTFSEHNFAAMLSLHINHEIPISYEPEGLQRPPDFKIVIGELIFWVQMKRLSELEASNRQDGFMREIEKAVKEIEISKFFGCEFSKHFSRTHIDDFVRFIAECAPESIEGKDYFFPSIERPIAKVDFWQANQSKVSCLTLGSSGDMDMVEVTGLVENQIRKSLINAAGAFSWDVEQYTINLVVIDADNKRDIDLCDAIFGTEFEIFRDYKHSWSRKNDGFFNLGEFSKKVAGVVAIKRKESKPVSSCSSMMFINDNFKDRLNDICKLLLFDKVIYRNMRPPMGNGDFDLG